MPTVNYIAANGGRRSVVADDGTSVMHAAVTNGVPGIDADCGGAASCATCHVYVDEEWLDRLPPIGDDEGDMLDCTASERRPNSRLSCQIAMSDALDGLTVHLPESQS